MAKTEPELRLVDGKITITGSYINQKGENEKFHLELPVDSINISQTRDAKFERSGDGKEMIVHQRGFEYKISAYKQEIRELS